MLCDDKPSNFDGFEKLPSAHGYLVDRNNKTHTDLPRVVKVNNLSEISL
jgi:hypothetical protein